MRPGIEGSRPLFVVDWGFCFVAFWKRRQSCHSDWQAWGLAFFCADGKESKADYIIGLDGHFSGMHGTA